MMDWIEREEIALGKALDSGEITESEYRKYSRELYEEQKQMAHDAAQEAYDGVMGGW